MPSTRLCLALVVALSAWAVAHADDPVYTCPNTCVPPECKCASTDIPGGFATNKTPMFVVVTYDDSIVPDSMPKVDGITHHKSANNCSLRVTYFTTSDFTYYDLAHQLWLDGHEIGAHTATHATTYTSTAEFAELEIKAGKLLVSRMGNIPEGHIRSFRAPGLEYSEALLGVLTEAGIHLDSSIKEYGNKGASWGSLISDGMGNKIWPYTLTHGVGQHCDSWVHDDCTQWKVPNVWELPIWSMDQLTGGQPVMLSVMDNLDVATLKTNFDARYAGNRTPMGVFLHPIRSSLAHLNEFLAYAATKDDVYFVTASQLQAWTANPVDTDHMHELFPTTCDMPGAGPTVSWPSPGEAGDGCTPEICWINNEQHYMCGPCPTTWPSKNDTLDEVCLRGTDVVGYNVCAGICKGYGTDDPLLCADIDCEVGEWSDWQCDVACGIGNRTRTREVVVAQRNDGAECPALTEDGGACDEGPCNRDCEVGLWGDWGGCSEACGAGTATRNRTVTVSHRGTGEICPALSDSQACQVKPCPVDCEVGQWAAWGACSAACGDGTYTREREVTVAQVGDGASCPTLTGSGACNNGPCNSDCLLSLWGDWGECTTDCGGHRTRNRTELVPQAGSGAACPAGGLEETELCAHGCGGTNNGGGTGTGTGTGTNTVDDIIASATAVVLNVHLTGVDAATVDASHSAFASAVSAVSAADAGRVVVEAVAASTLRRRLAVAAQAPAADDRQLRGGARALAEPAAVVGFSIRSTSLLDPPSSEMAGATFMDAVADGSFAAALTARGLPVTSAAMSGSMQVVNLATVESPNQQPGNGGAQPGFSGQEAGGGADAPDSGGDSSMLLIGGLAVVAVVLVAVGAGVYMVRRRRKAAALRYRVMTVKNLRTEGLASDSPTAASAGGGGGRGARRKSGGRRSGRVQPVGPDADDASPKAAAGLRNRPSLTSVGVDPDSGAASANSESELLPHKGSDSSAPSSPLALQGAAWVEETGVGSSDDDDDSGAGGGSPGDGRRGSVPRDDGDDAGEGDAPPPTYLQSVRSGRTLTTTTTQQSYYEAVVSRSRPGSAADAGGAAAPGTPTLQLGGGL